MPDSEPNEIQVHEVDAKWYKPDIGPRLKPAIEQVYKEWSGLAEDELVIHLHKIVGQGSLPQLPSS